MSLLTEREERIAAKNKELIAALTEKFESHEGPRIGDWGSYARLFNGTI